MEVAYDYRVRQTAARLSDCRLLREEASQLPSASLALQRPNFQARRPAASADLQVRPRTEVQNGLAGNAAHLLKPKRGCYACGAATWAVELPITGA